MKSVERGIMSWESLQWQTEEETYGVYGGCVRACIGDSVTLLVPTVDEPVDMVFDSIRRRTWNDSPQ